MMALSSERGSLYGDVSTPSSPSTGSGEVRECRRRGCSTAAADDSEYCDEHAKRQRQYQAAYMSRRRAAFARKKLCTRCGRKRRPGSKWCSRCMLRDPRMKIPPVTLHVENKAARVLAATAIGTDGRERYHGTAKKGRRPIVEEHMADFDLIEPEVAAARKAIAHSWSPEVEQLPRIQRDEARMAALDRVFSLYRLLGDILRRGKHPLAPEVGPTDEKDED